MTEIEKLTIKYSEYLYEHSSGFPEDALKYIKDNFWKCRNSFDIPDIMMQIYSELGVFNDNDNVYLKHLSKIESIFDIGCNVLEIGGGMMPAFGNIVAKEQIRIKSGTITVYDPMLCTTETNFTHMTLKKEKFNFESDISSFDLVVGIMPCDATEDLIKKVCTLKKNFYIQMCGCTHFSIDQIRKYGLSEEAYQQYIIKLANKTCCSEINVDKIDSKLANYPLLYKKF